MRCYLIHSPAGHPGPLRQASAGDLFTDAGGNSPTESYRRAAALLASATARAMLLLTLATFAAGYLVLRFWPALTREVVFWPASGVAAGYALSAWHGSLKRRIGLAVATFAGVLSGSSAAGVPVWQAAAWAAMTVLDLLLTASFLSPHVKTFDDLKRRGSILRFALAMSGVPIISGAAVLLPAALLLHGGMQFSSLQENILGDLLGLALVLPAVLFITTGEYRTPSKLAPHLRSATGACALFLVFTAVIFWHCPEPFLFVLFPPMMLVILLLGLEGAIFCALALQAIGWWATAHGHGPIWHIPGSSPLFRTEVLQIFVWLYLATALPVGALLDERRRAERGLVEAQTVYQLLLQNTEDAMVLSSVDGARRYASPAIEGLTGWQPKEYLRFERSYVVHPDDHDILSLMNDSLRQGKGEHTIRYRLRQKAGGWRWVEARVRGYGHGSMTGYVATIRDVSALRQAEKAWQEERRALTQERQHMADLAGTDPLTGLLNRRGLEQGMRLGASEANLPFAVLMIDIDFFKQFNDRYGHGAGDRCLVRLGDAVCKRAGRREDLVARFGGEEFTVILGGTDVQGGLAVAQAICRDLHEAAWEHAGSPFGFVSVSIGVAAHPGQALCDINLLLAQADRALYASKHAGRNRATVFTGAGTALPTAEAPAEVTNASLAATA